MRPPSQKCLGIVRCVSSIFRQDKQDHVLFAGMECKTPSGCSPITSHYLTLQHVSLPYGTVHYSTLRYVAAHDIRVHYTRLPYIRLGYITLH